ncbi:acyl-CoA dehydrogenase [Aquabacterium sp.]|uniref:acyl-CoA dehydrogenase n=1 Tax=Aquabacterium sp. TaxID=1872578 RepID=UPI003783004A
MSTLDAPSPLADADLHTLRSAATQAEAEGRLLPPQLALIHQRGWLKMLAPRAVGGDEWPLPAVVRLEEALAAADGSVGWTVTLCAGAGWFAGFLPPALARSILATPAVCLAGSGMPGGVAEASADGWRLSGHWGHASGAPMATHFTCNAQLQCDGRPCLDERGQPRVRAFVLPAAQVTLHDSWHSIGLKASASQAFSVDAARLAPEQAFDITPAAATVDGPLYRFPFRPFAFVTLAANLLGLAGRFIALAEPLLAQRDARLGTALQTRWQAEQAALAQARREFYEVLDHSWQRVAAGAALPLEAEQALERQSRTIVQVARQAVDGLYPLCGLQAADPRQDINRVWRDLHTATQHALWLPAGMAPADPPG